ncbi:hypothetical protein [Cohnella lupini]|uniref:Uncharacterized protein n=1 Tax=Cohnella lupini TaxID=1294267 RepID=A0A3D9ISB7_9BACL|nr:hypothetical protein [Cohnella lupini]RED64016.1 hypothetical protein DFP95_103257 [Cohnella lupini]
MNRSNQSPDGSYLFNVEITVSSSSKGAALVQLQQALNHEKITDYRIESVTEPEESVLKAPVSPSSKKAVPKAPPQPNPLELRIRQYIESNKLIRLNINKGRGVKMSIPCRVINFDASDNLLTVYHVDEKQVYSVGLNEIDDFVD